MAYIPTRKFLPPRRTEPYVARPGVADALDHGQAYRVTVVWGEAGLGKTQAVLAYEGEREAPFLWLRPGIVERAAPGFLRLLLLAATAAHLPVPTEALDALESAPDAWAVVLDTLFDLWWDQAPLHVIVDDAHYLEQGSAVDVVNAMIEGLPDGWRVILAGRHAPEGLRLARLQTDRALWTVSPDTLHMTASEQAALVLELTGHQLDPDHRRRLAASTTGWITGLIIAVQAWQSRDTTDLDELVRLAADPRVHLPFLVEEVVARQDDDLQRFLLQSAWLAELDPDTCRDVLGPDAPAHLQEVVRRHLFVHPLDDRAYQYHPLFRQALQELAMRRLSPDERRQITERSTHVMDPVAAVDEQVTSPEAHRPDDWLQPLADRLLMQGAALNLHAVVEALPASVQKSPWWHLLHGQLDFLQGKPDACIERVAALTQAADPAVRGRALTLTATVRRTRSEADALALVRRALDVLPDSDGLGRAWAFRLQGVIHKLLDQPEAARRALEAALTLYRQAGAIAGESRALRALADLALWQGNVDDADGLLEQACDLARGIKLVLPANHYVGGFLAALRGRYAAAIAHAEAGLAVAATVDNQLAASEFLYLRGLARTLAGHWEAAEADLTASLTKATAMGHRPFMFASRIMLADLALRQDAGDDAAQHLAAASDWLPQDSQLTHRYALLEVRLQLQAGNLEAARRLSDALLDLQNRPDQSQLSVPEAWYWHGRMLEGQGDVTQAATAYAQSRDRGRRQGTRYWPIEETPGKSPPVLAVPIGWRFQFFGGFEASVGGRVLAPSEWPGKKTRILLTMLMLEPSGLSRESLAERFYPGETVGRSVVAVLITRLRQALLLAAGEPPPPNPILLLNGRYALSPNLSLKADLLDFDRAWEAAITAADDMARAAAYRRILDVYQGPLLAETADNAWVMATRALFHARWERAREWLFQRALEARDPNALLHVADVELALDPGSESANRRKLQALWALGQAEAARHHFQQWAHGLEVSTGRGPGPEGHAFWTALQSRPHTL